MVPVFLIGGGWRVETFSQTFNRFVQCAESGGRKKIAIVVAEEPETDSHAQFLRFFEAFEKIGLKPGEAFESIVSGKAPLTAEKLNAADATGVFVCGGLTPAFYDALCIDRRWLEYLFERNIPYCGFSAGAAIAATEAIVGGWQRRIGERTVNITNENAGEDLDLLEVRPGLALVPFAVDAHASEWGTLSRLIHAVDARLASEGWAIDENTMLEIVEGKRTIHGAGSAYFVRRDGAKTALEIFRAE